MFKIPSKTEKIEKIIENKIYNINSVYFFVNLYVFTKHTYILFNYKKCVQTRKTLN